MVGSDEGVDVRDPRSGAEPDRSTQRADGEADSRVRTDTPSPTDSGPPAGTRAPVDNRSPADKRSPAGNRAPADKRSPAGNRSRSRRRFYTYPITNFYPGYSNSVGRLDRIAPISSVRMQRVLPRYQMSTEQTRTSGLGPPLIDYPVSVEISGDYGSPLSRMVEEGGIPAAAAGSADRGVAGGDESGEASGRSEGDLAGRSESGEAGGSDRIEQPSGRVRGGSKSREASGESEEIDDDSRGRIIDIEA